MLEEQSVPICVAGQRRKAHAGFQRAGNKGQRSNLCRRAAFRSVHPCIKRRLQKHAGKDAEKRSVCVLGNPLTERAICGRRCIVRAGRIVVPYFIRKTQILCTFAVREPESADGCTDFRARKERRKIRREDRHPVLLEAGCKAAHGVCADVLCGENNLAQVTF